MRFRNEGGHVHCLNLHETEFSVGQEYAPEDYAIKHRAQKTECNEQHEHPRVGIGQVLPDPVFDGDDDQVRDESSTDQESHELYCDLARGEHASTHLRYVVSRIAH